MHVSVHYSFCFDGHVGTAHAQFGALLTAIYAVGLAQLEGGHGRES